MGLASDLQATLDAQRPQLTAMLNLFDVIAPSMPEATVEIKRFKAAVETVILSMEDLIEAAADLDAKAHHP